MKVNIELDLTPQEARELMGWPDMGGMQKLLMTSLSEKLQNASSEQVEDMLKPFMEQGQQAFAQYQSFLQSMGQFNKPDGPKSKT